MAMVATLRDNPRSSYQACNGPGQVTPPLRSIKGRPLIRVYKQDPRSGATSLNLRAGPDPTNPAPWRAATARKI